MEFKTCNECGKSKPVNLFYLLKKGKPWRRSRCIKCHKKKDDLNRRIRNGITYILILIATLFAMRSFAQHQLLDSINYYRKMPARANVNYGINLRLKLYIPIHKYEMDADLNKLANKLAKKMARRGKYFFQGNHNQTVYRISTDRESEIIQDLIVNKYVPSKGNRNHLLLCKDDVIGIGVARDKKGNTYICIQTDKR